MPNENMSDFSRSCLILEAFYSFYKIKAFHKTGDKYTGVPTKVFLRLWLIFSPYRVLETPKSVIFGSSFNNNIFSGLMSLW